MTKQAFERIFWTAVEAVFALVTADPVTSWIMNVAHIDPAARGVVFAVTTAVLTAFGAVVKTQAARYVGDPTSPAIGFGVDSGNNGNVPPLAPPPVP